MPGPKVEIDALAKTLRVLTGDKVYCIDIAPDEASVREHARQGGFRANRVSAVTTVIDPTTAE